MRPDAAERQRRAQSAAEHDAWFRGEVAQAIKEANAADAVWIDNNEATTRWRRRREALQRQIGDKKIGA